MMVVTLPLRAAARLREGGSTMSEIHPVNDYYREHGFVDEAGYEARYRRSVEDNEAYWAEQAGIVDWARPFTKVKDVS